MVKRNPLIRKIPQAKGKTEGGHKSAGILDDFSVRKNVATREGTIEKVPVNDSDIVNKKYVDDFNAQSHDGFGDTANSTAHDKYLRNDTNSSMNTHKIIEVVDPVNLQDVATKKYVDSQISGISTPWDDDLTYLHPTIGTRGMYVLGVVGIGTATQNTKLRAVGGDIGINKSYFIKWLEGDTIKAAIGTDTNDNLNFFTTGGSNRLTILDGGNVGIGTTAPTSNLHVAGTDPEIRLTNNGDSESVWTKRETGKGSVKNQVVKPGGAGKALDFDGAGDFVNCGSDSSLEITGDITISAWIKVPLGDTSPGSIFSRLADHSPWYGYTFRVSAFSDGKISFLNLGGGWKNSLGTVNDGNWHYVVVTGDISATSGAFYIDGAQSGTFTFESPGALNANAYIGTDSVSVDFTGIIDEVRVYTRGLEQAEITYNYNGGAGVYIPSDTSGIVGWWHLDEGFGLYAMDSSDEHNQGTLTGVPNWVDGHISSSTTTEEALVWESKDGINPGEQGIQTFGDDDGTTIIQGKTQKFFIGASEKMRIDDDGKVGVGTTTPGYYLDIKSSDFINLAVHRDTNTLTNGTGIDFNLNNSAGTATTYGEIFSIISGNVAGNEKGYLEFRTRTNGALQNRVTIQSDGKVGIGTITPTSMLQVIGIPVYADNAAAITGGLTAGAFYRTGSDPDPVCVVH